MSDELYEVDYVDEEKLSDVTESSTISVDEDYDYLPFDNEIEDSDYDYSYDDYDYDTSLPVEEEAVDIEEEEEDVDINIDEGFLNDENNEPVELPVVPRKSNVVAPSSNGSVVLAFLLIGGLNPDGSTINIIDLLNPGLGNSVVTALHSSSSHCGYCRRRNLCSLHSQVHHHLQQRSKISVTIWLHLHCRILLCL